MRILFLFFVFLSSLLLAPQFSFGDVFVPVDEYVGYFDSNDVYTVVGNVKNEFDYAIIPTITISIKDNSEIYSQIIQHVPLGAGTEIPFKIKFPNVTGNNLVLMPVELSFEKTQKDTIPISVLYDQTLKRHDDGHLTGRIQNVGEYTIYNPKIFAVVHGYDTVLDIAQNIEFIEKINPGEILDFSMYPDPSITDEIFYYSCFAPVDTTVVPITAKKNDGNFDFRYDSGAWYSAAKFDKKGTTLSIQGYNSYPLETYANFEFPPISGDEKFTVTSNGEPIEFIQSIDEMGFWHIAFVVGPTSQSTIQISGFEKGLPSTESPKILPPWIKNNAAWWSDGILSDSEFFKGIEWMISNGVITI